MFNSSNAQSCGHKGGSAKTLKKQKAARTNGKKGGRRTKRCLAEHLLNQRISAYQHKFIAKAFDQLFDSEKQEFAEYFGSLNILTSGAQRLPRRIPKRIRFLIQKFTLAARYLLREAPAPKEYVIEYRERSDAEIELWDKHHPDVPCPPRRIRVYVTEISNFLFLKHLYAKHPDTTANDIREWGGSKWGGKRAEAALAVLRFEAENRENKSS